MDDLARAVRDPEQMVTVARFEDPMEAQMAKGLLETAGIDYFLQGENANSLLGVAFRARLLVHRRDEAMAREILPGPDDEDAQDREDEG